MERAYGDGRGRVGSRWLAADELDLFFGLCEARGLDSGSFPERERIEQMMRTCREVVRGVFAEGDGGEILVGAAVIWPLRAGAQERIADRRIADGRGITRKDLESSWSRARYAYIACVVAREHCGSQVMSAVRIDIETLGAKVLAVYTRPSTPEGRRAVDRYRFEPLWPGGEIFERRLESPQRWRLGRSRIRRQLPELWRRGELSYYDNMTRGFASVARAGKWGLLFVYGVLLVATIASALSGVVVPFDEEVRRSLVAPLISSAATLGGLATTVFFLTAQLKITGVSQYGLTALYRFRDYAPVLGSSFATIAAAVATILSAPPRADSYLLFALISLGLLMVSIVLQSIDLITNMDPVTVARKFLGRVNGDQAEQWGLAKVRINMPDDGHDAVFDIRLKSHRSNFGLRDPLMPVHEILQKASKQRYGQIVSCMAEQIVGAYDGEWTMQFPDIHRWHTAARAGDPRAPGLDDGQWSQEGAALRLQLAMLYLHYLRRVHRNRTFDLTADDRRQTAQFVISRLIVVLARDSRLDEDHRDGPVQVLKTRQEFEQVLRLCVIVVTLIGSDFRTGAHRIEPSGRPDSLMAFVYAIKALQLAGFGELSADAAEALAWLLESPNLSRADIQFALEELAFDPDLRAIVVDAHGDAARLERPRILEPVGDREHPWKAFEDEVRATRMSVAAEREAAAVKDAVGRLLAEEAARAVLEGREPLDPPADDERAAS